jgi:hypothetical protein
MTPPQHRRRRQGRATRLRRPSAAQDMRSRTRTRDTTAAPSRGLLRGPQPRRGPDFGHRAVHLTANASKRLGARLLRPRRELHLL